MEREKRKRIEVAEILTRNNRAQATSLLQTPSRIYGSKIKNANKNTRDKTNGKITNVMKS